MLEQPRLSLTSTVSYDVQYRAFRKAKDDALNKCGVMRKISPLMASSSMSLSSSGTNSFSNLENLTDGTIVDVKSDICDGADPSQLDQGILVEQDNYIRPLAGAKTPVVM